MRLARTDGPSGELRRRSSVVRAVLSGGTARALNADGLRSLCLASFMVVGVFSQAQNTLGTLAQGQPVVAQSSGGTGATAVSSALVLDAAQFSSSTDICGAISAACQTANTTLGGAGMDVDARGYAAIGSNNVCSVTNAHGMLTNCSNGGKVLLGSEWRHDSSREFNPERQHASNQQHSIECKSEPRAERHRSGHGSFVEPHGRHANDQQHGLEREPEPCSERLRSSHGSHASVDGQFHGRRDNSICAGALAEGCWRGRANGADAVSLWDADRRAQRGNLHAVLVPLRPSRRHEYGHRNRLLQ